MSRLAVRLRSAVDVAHNQPRADHFEPLERRNERRRHRNLASTTALRRARDAMTRLLVHRQRPGDEIDVLTPTQRSHLTDAQSRLARQAHCRVPLRALALRSVEDTRV